MWQRQPSQKPRDCASCGKSYDSQEENLIPVEQVMPESGRKATRDEALHWLQQIKPQVRRQGTDGVKRAWNHLYQMIRDGKNPDLALQDLQFSSGGRTLRRTMHPTMPSDRQNSCAWPIPTWDGTSRGLRRRGRHAARRYTRQQTHLSRTTTERFLRLTEEAREKMIAKWKY